MCISPQIKKIHTTHSTQARALYQTSSINVFWKKISPGGKCPTSSFQVGKGVGAVFACFRYGRVSSAHVRIVKILPLPLTLRVEFNLRLHVYSSNLLLETEENKMRCFVSWDNMHVILIFNIGKVISPFYF